MDVLDFLIPFPTWLMLLLLAIGLLAFYFDSTYGVFRRLGIQHPKPWPIVGNTLFTLKHGFFDTCVLGYERFKRTGLYGVYEGNVPVLIITDLDILKEIMIKQFNTFIDRKRYAAMDQKGIDSIMFNTTGATWKEYRALLRPQLATARLKAVGGRVDTLCRRMLSVLKEKATKDKNVEIGEVIGCFCMDVIADLGFDVQCDSLKNPHHDFVACSRRVLDVFGERLFTYEFFAPFFLKPILDFLGIMILPKKDIYFLREFTKKALETRRLKSRDQIPDDFLQYMIDRSGKKNMGNKRQFTEEEIYGASVTYFLAGYDTSAKGFSYAIYNLAMNPHCLKRAQKEVDEVLKGEFPTMNNIDDLTYLDMCIYESNRLYPLGYFVERKCQEDVTIKGQFIPKGMNIRIPIAGIHRDPEIYPNPTVYDPERFQPEMVAKRHQMAYLPFGAGPRSCFGQPLAMMLMRIGMAAILQKFDMEACDKSEYPIRIIPLSDIMPEHGLWLKLTPRK